MMDVAFDLVGKDNDGFGYGFDRSTNLWVKEFRINFCNEIFEFLHQHGVIGIDVASTGGNKDFGADWEFTREIKFEKDFVLEDLKRFVGSIVEEDSSNNVPAGRQRSHAGWHRVKLVSSRVAPGGSGFAGSCAGWKRCSAGRHQGSNVPAGRQRSPVGWHRPKLVSSRVTPGGRVVRRAAVVSPGAAPGGRDVLPGGTKDLYSSNPGTQQWQAIQRVQKYLKKTMDYKLTYTGYPSMLEGYTDASWISNTEDNSSTSGWVFLLSGGAIY
nr:zinc finger, CCHC-type [Tanacetum cinerariifolium]